MGQAEEVVLPTVDPDCSTQAAGLAETENKGWDAFEGMPALGCVFIDEALPPILPRYELQMQVMFGSDAEIDSLWNEIIDDDSTTWRVRRGEPVDFAVTSLFNNVGGLIGQQVWCPNEAPSLADCSWSEFGVVRTGGCSLVSFATEVNGLDAPELAIGEVRPDFDWNTIERLANELTTNNGALVDESHRDGCVRTCEMWGTALDIEGVPVRHAVVEVGVGTRPLGTGSTDGSGAYSVRFKCEKGPDFDPAMDRPHVDLVLSDSRGRYDVYGGPTGEVIVRFRTDEVTIREDEDRYSRDFRFRAIPAGYRQVAGNESKPRWYEWVEIYQNMAEAWALADMLGEQLDYALPLDVVGNCTFRPECDASKPNFAFHLENGGDPFLAFGSATSRYSDSGRPDNREYHELGHFFMGDTWDNDMPSGSGNDRSHRGLENATSTPGIVEGFAEWYSTMVQRHVIGDPDAHLYTFSGIDLNLEADIDVWDPRHGRNAEEFAIAGLLLDLEDGPDDYATDPVRPATSVQSVTALATQSARVQPYEVVVRNDGQAVTDDLVVTMVLLENGEEVRRIPGSVVVSNLAPGRETTALVVIPIAPELFSWDGFRIEVTENVMVRPARDDDDIDLTLDEVWTTLRDYRALNVRTHFVTDLYAAFSAKVGTADANRNGRPDIDDLFIAHGLYSDADGLHVYDPGVDIIGRTDTPTHSPRHSASYELPGAKLKIEGLPAGTTVDIAVLPNAPLDYLADIRRTEVDDDGYVWLTTPPTSIGGHTTVVGVLPNGSQIVVADYTTAEIVDQIESGVPGTVDVSDRTGGGLGADASGYRMLGADGTVYSFGSATDLGSPADRFDSGERAVAMAVTPSGDGYSVLSDAYAVYRYGDAPALGAASSHELLPGERLTAIAISPTGSGTWIFSSRGRVLAFGDADHFGDLLALDLQGEIIGSVVTPSGLGYYLIGSDGGVFAFGDAEFHGSIQGIVNELVGPGFPATEWLACPIVGLVPTPTGDGYWLVACDGGVFSFGSAPYRGSVPEVLPGVTLNRPINGMVAYGGGYLMVASDGGAFNFGAPFFGSLGANPPSDPIVAITAYSG